MSFQFSPPFLDTITDEWHARYIIILYLILCAFIILYTRRYIQSVLQTAAAGSINLTVLRNDDGVGSS